MSSCFRHYIESISLETSKYSITQLMTCSFHLNSGREYWVFLLKTFNSRNSARSVIKISLKLMKWKVPKKSTLKTHSNLSIQVSILWQCFPAQSALNHILDIIKLQRIHELCCSSKNLKRGKENWAIWELAAYAVKIDWKCFSWKKLPMNFLFSENILNPFCSYRM